MIKRFLVRAALIFICLFIWVPLLLMAGNALMSEGEMLQRFGAIFGMGNAPVKAVFLPEYPTLRPLVELLIDSPGFYVMFWNSCFQTGMVLLGQLVVALLGAWGFACFQFKGKKALFLLYIILMMQPFQVTMVPNYLVLKRFYLLNTHLAVILPGIFSVSYLYPGDRDGIQGPGQKGQSRHKGQKCNCCFLHVHSLLDS